MATESFEHAASTEQEEVSLLRQINARLESIDDRLELQNTTLSEISTTLTTFVQEWQQANTPSPAVSAAIVWGKPQPIPKGP